MKKPKNLPPQRERFIEKARELECDEDEGRFNETLKTVLEKPPLSAGEDVSKGSTDNPTSARKKSSLHDVGNL